MKLCWLAPLVLLVAGCASTEALVVPPRPEAVVRRGGGAVSLRAADGQLLLVDFFASWCAPCREALPHHAALATRLSGRVELLLVSVDEDPAALEALLARHGPLPFPIGLDPDGRVAAAFEVRAMPTAVLVDRAGVERWRGAAYSTAELDAAIEEALRTPPP